MVGLRRLGREARQSETQAVSPQERDEPCLAELKPNFPCLKLFSRVKINVMAANWTQLILGLWIILSPWLLGFSSITVMKWNNLFAGTVIFLVNVWIIFGEKRSSATDPKNPN